MGATSASRPSFRKYSEFICILRYVRWKFFRGVFASPYHYLCGGTAGTYNVDAGSNRYGGFAIDGC